MTRVVSVQHDNSSSTAPGALILIPTAPSDPNEPELPCNRQRIGAAARMLVHPGRCRDAGLPPAALSVGRQVYVQPKYSTSTEPVQYKHSTSTVQAQP